jgi:hypothetical protein
MNRQELQDAIEKPAHLLGVRIEEGLSERLLEAVGEEPGNLPLLEFALTQLWSRRRYRMLTHAAYEEIGGVKQALAVHAEEAFRKLDPQEEQRVRRIFTQLVQPSQATEDTRRIATESELGRENWGLVTRLADERLVVTGRDEASEEETAEIVHEALIREWERLRQWTNEDREFRQWQERLRLTMQQWEVIGRDNGALLRGGLLAEAERWVGERGGELAEAERDYILTSITMREQEQERVARERMQEQERIANERRRRRIISGLAMGLGIALILATLAGWQWLEADTWRRIALSGQLAAQTISLSSQGLLDRALLLSQEALRISETTEARSALLTALQYSPGLTTFLRRHDGPVGSIAFSPDRRILASGGYDRTVILWDPQSRQPIGEPFKGHDAGVSSVAFSPDGRTLASGSGDSTVILWDPQTRQQIGEPLRGHDVLGDVGVSSVAFSPNGRVLASGSGDNIIILWDVDIEPWKERACRIANRNLTLSEWAEYLKNEPYHQTCPNVPEGR